MINDRNTVEKIFLLIAENRPQTVQAGTRLLLIL